MTHPMSRCGYCPYCGHEGSIIDGVNVCSNCGAEFQLATVKPPG